MLVYNRWGELLFKSDDLYKGWSGRYKGNMCQTGTYVWKITYTETSGENGQMMGHVNLIK